MKKSIAGVAALLVLLASPARALPLGNSSPSLFTTEQAAQAYCPSDVVVWLNLTTNSFDTRGEALYGKKSGSYACKQEALLAGATPSRNGR